jgi:hypothetical protein
MDPNTLTTGTASMNRAFVILAAGAALVAAAPAAAAAQSAIPFSVEGRLDVGIPVGDSADGLDRAVGWGAQATLEIAPSFGVYGAYSRFDFDRDALLGSRVRDEGFALGGRLLMGTGAGVSTPYVMLGALFHDGDTGIEAGLGAEYPVTYALSVTPMARYRSVSGIDYVTLGAGLSFRF